MIDFYRTHFGLTGRPFTLVPDAEVLYMSKVHRRAKMMIEYGIVSRAPITLVTGELGMGKTTLLRALMGELRQDVTMVLLSSAIGGPEDMLRWLMHEIDAPIAPGETHVDLLTRFQRYLIEEYAAGRRVLLIVDEAQNLSLEALETLRMMTNINCDKHELIQLLLLGQPELRERICAPGMMQFAQRVAAGCHVEPMEAEDSAGYVRHRLALAGAGHEIFSPEALARVHALTGGVPRLINQLCDMALVYAYSDLRRDVDAALIETIVEDGSCFFLLHRQWRREIGLSSVA